MSQQISSNLNFNLALNFDSEWIDNQQSPQRQRTDRSFQGDIQIEGFHFKATSGKFIQQQNQSFSNQHHIKQQQQHEQLQILDPNHQELLNNQYNSNNSNNDQNINNNYNNYNQQMQISMDESFYKNKISKNLNQKFNLLDNQMQNILEQQNNYQNQQKNQYENQFIQQNKQNNQLQNQFNQIQLNSPDQKQQSKQNEQQINSKSHLGQLNLQSMKQLKFNNKQSQQNQPQNLVQFIQTSDNNNNNNNNKDNNRNNEQLQTNEQSISNNISQISQTQQPLPTQVSKHSDPTITINEHSFFSKLHQQLSSFSYQSNLLKSMSSFLQNNKLSYNPFYIILQQIFLNSKLISQKSISNSQMYLDFFKEKYHMIEKYLIVLTNQKIQKIYQNVKKQQINDLVYIDTKVVLRDIHQKNVKKAKIYKEFFKQLTQIYKNYKQAFKTIKQKRTSLSKTISSTISQIRQLQSDLTQIIQYRFNLQQNPSNFTSFQQFKNIFKVQNPYIYKDNYLQIKFIIQKQQYYLQKLIILRNQSIKFLNSIFLNDEVYMAIKLKESIINYTNEMIELQRKQKIIYQKQNQDNLLDNIIKKRDALQAQKISEQLKMQLGKILYDTLPKNFISELGYDQNTSSASLSLSSQKLLEQINQYFQNQVFMNSIQLQNQFIFYKTQGRWLPKIQVNPNQSKSKLTIILSVQKYLHMEIDQKIATMKLNQIKISQKGKFIILIDKGKGFVGYLVNNGNQLGRIQFENIQETNTFTNKLKELIQNK